MGDQARVMIWDPKTLQTKYILSETQGNNICCLAFDETGCYLAVVSNDRLHTVSIYDWQNDTLMCKFFAGASKVLSLTFFEGTTGLELLTVGLKHIKYWKSILSKFPQCVSPSFAGIGRLQSFLSCIVFQSFQIVGTAEGTLYIFQNYALKQLVKAHVGGVFSMCKSSQSSPTSILMTGGQDGAIRVWDNSFECKKEVSLESLSKNHFHAVRALALNVAGDCVLAGTQGGEVMEIKWKDAALQQNGIFIHGHSISTWGLAVHPSADIFATTGDDALLR
jgi:WD40 repeat protein